MLAGVLKTGTSPPLGALRAMRMAVLLALALLTAAVFALAQATWAAIALLFAPFFSALLATTQFASANSTLAPFLAFTRHAAEVTTAK